MTEDEPKIDPSKIRDGDEVDIRVKVCAAHTDDEGNLSIQVIPRAWFAPSDIIAHHPRQLEVGDRVKSQRGIVWEAAAKGRVREDGELEYPMWNDGAGFAGIPATALKSWERIQ